ncbi:MAG: SDR family NAD(P)-dependent oxidoreductase [Rhodospirillaceae bacterium]|nr:SDR family NAD(P)-dependent oxidoreductase [Rhodospirillaceae bacterium]MDE0616700.1 SDR family NAD(P)-dependent oxidoreductase [Rhodospirillaceae bacterium]
MAGSDGSRFGERFGGRAAVITGGASGIGRAAVLRFLEEGASVTFADLNDANAEGTLALARAAGHGDRIAYVRADVTDEAAVKDCFEAAAARWGRLDVAFLNAGVGGAIGPVTETTVAEWDTSFAFLVRSVFLGAKHAVPAMRANPPRPDGSPGGVPAGGAIVATGSVAGLSGGGGPHAYSAAKAAVINLVRSLALELASWRIRVNGVAPGLIDTPLAHGGDPSRLPDMSERQPWPDRGRPEDIAAAAAFLASDDARFITGETITVDGGVMANSSNIWGLGENCRFLQKAGLNKGTTGLENIVRDLGEAP